MRNWQWGKVLCLALLAGSVQAEPQWLLAGDSTVENVPAKMGDRKGWGQVVGQYLKPEVKVINLAMGGRSTKTFIAEKRWTNLLKQSRPGDFILIQFGHNDSHGKDKPESTDAATDYKNYLRIYADEALKAGARVIFVTPPHRRSFDKTGKLTPELLPYADAMKAVAQEKNIPVVDLYTLTGEKFQQLGDAACRPIFCSDTDRTHFSTQGAELLAKMIIADLQKQNLPAAACIK